MSAAPAPSGDLLALILERGGLLASLVTVWLILRTQAVGALAARLLNGQTKNGAPKRDHAGEASVDYWRNAFREIAQEIFDRHELAERERLDAITESVERTERGCSERHAASMHSEDARNAALVAAIGALTQQVEGLRRGR